MVLVYLLLLAVWVVIAVIRTLTTRQEFDRDLREQLLVEVRTVGPTILTAAYLVVCENFIEGDTWSVRFLPWCVAALFLRASSGPIEYRGRQLRQSQRERSVAVREDAASGQPAEPIREALTVREFFHLQCKPYRNHADLGPGCCIVGHRGFFLLNTLDYVEVVPGDESLTNMLELAEVLSESGPDIDQAAISRNDVFGSRRRAPETTNDGLRAWTFAQVNAGRDRCAIVSELMASGVNWSGARALVAAIQWIKNNPDRGLPTQADIAPFLK